MYQFIPTILILSIFLGLNACSTPTEPLPTQPESPIQPEKAPELSTEESLQRQLAELERNALQAKNNQAWANFIQFSEQLWLNSDADNQAAIEYQIWQTLKPLSPETLTQLAQQSPELSDWIGFTEITQQHPIWQKQRLKDWKDITADSPHTLYNYHLLPALLNKLNQPKPVSHIAVMLPFTGQYARISQQIRNGILKQHFQKLQSLKQGQPPLTLRFYDSSDLTQIQSTYQTAISQGAQWVIGPLRKAAIEQLAPLAPTHILALNQVDLDSFWQFNFKSESEAAQMTKQLCQQNYQRIGILSSTSDADTRLAQDILFDWRQHSESQSQTAILKTYPTRRPNLRQALGGLINEKQSQARKNNLHWLFRQKIHFNPRLRQDLDAIVLVGNERQLAVFKPQFEFFDLKLPTYASSKITPTQLSQTKPNRDLADLIFPTLPASINTSPVETPFEAFGWDSLSLVQNLHRLDSGLCLNNGLMGQLKVEDQQIDHLFSWARYNAQGKVVALKLIDTDSTSE